MTMTRTVLAAMIVSMIVAGISPGYACAQAGTETPVEDLDKTAGEYSLREALAPELEEFKGGFLEALPILVTLALMAIGLGVMAVVFIGVGIYELGYAICGPDSNPHSSPKGSDGE